MTPADSESVEIVDVDSPLPAGSCLDRPGYGTPDYGSLRMACLHTLWFRSFASLMMASAVSVSCAFAQLNATPGTFVLDGPEATQQLLASQTGAIDVTRKVHYAVENPVIVRVDETGLVVPLREGKTRIQLQHDGVSTSVEVLVQGLNQPAPVSFEQQIIPLLTKATCNSGGCHGKAEGQNGFKLSVFGFDPEADYEAIVSESRGRRIFPGAPEQSLLLAKGTGSMPHGGGKKLQEDSLAYRRLVRWIAEGMRYRSEDVSPIVAIEVEPKERLLPLGGSQQLRVTAIDSRGKRRCVTHEAEYETNARTIAEVDRRGHVQAGQIPGEAAILIRYMGQVAVSRITIPRPGIRFVRPAEANFIDRHVWNKLEQLGIPPSDLASDSQFLRRVFLDTIGTLPTAAEARAFLENSDPSKRSAMIDKLLNRPEYADYWAMRWSDLLRVDRDIVTPAGAMAMTRWLRDQFTLNRPYDEFVREILTAEGSVSREGPAGFLRALDKPEVMSRSVSQLFLGVRIECAQCHHHPSEKWSQDDYFALAGFFTGVSRKSGPAGDRIVWTAGSDVKHSRTGKMVPARALGDAPAQFSPNQDRRQLLADWMTSHKNSFFARAIVNRLWSHYLGRGLVEPIDDLRMTNPASNEPLLDALAEHLHKQQFDLKAWTRTVLNSRVYQLGGPSKENGMDEQNFSHARPKPLPAEVLLDAICQTTGVPEKFNGWPEGVRAIQMWDNRIPSYFLKLFGRPVRTSVCECERSGEPSISQALHLMNAPEINAKIHSRRGIARRLAESSLSPDQIVDELYLGVLSRYPKASEQAAMSRLFQQTESNRREATEDALWALLNTREFVFNR